MTDRTFHRKPSAEALVAIGLLGAASLFCFWQRDTLMAIAGTVVICTCMTAIERVVHTTYMFCGHQLVVSKGRLSAPVTVNVGEITSAERHRTALRLSGYLLLQTGKGRHLCVEPDNPQGFLKELKKRQQHDENTL